MKKKILLPVLSMMGLLASCSALSSGSSSFAPGGNHDTDPTAEITDSGTETEYDDKDDVVVDVTEPDSYQEATGNVISEAGHYHFSGEQDPISITAAKNSVVYVYFDGVSISSSSGIAFSSEKAITLYLILLNNSVNSIENDFADANAFHVKGNVYISGSGTLNVVSKQKNGVKVSKDLFVTEGVTLNVTGANHAIAARSLIAKDCTISVTTSKDGKDGVQLECDSDVSSFTNEQGYAHLTNVTFTSDTYGDGIQANSYIYISGGSYNIKTTGVFVSYSEMSTYELESDDYKYIKSGNEYKRIAKDDNKYSMSSRYALAQSCKGLKISAIEYNNAEITTGDYEISLAHQASFVINTTDDGVHTNYGKTTLDSVTLEIDTKDDGVQADYALSVNNSSITVNSSYEALEGATVTVDGSQTVLVLNSEDDGINAASDYSSTNNIYIKDGYLRVYAAGDGLDANTGLYLQGGTVIVEGPGSGNGSLDAENVYIQGGIVFACSTGGMSERTTCTQNTFKYQGSSMAANSEISIVDSSSNTSLFTYTLKQSCNQIIFSHASMNVGSSYKIMKGTTQVTSITLTSSYTQSGSSQGGGGGGFPGGGPGGWR